MNMLMTFAAQATHPCLLPSSLPRSSPATASSRPRAEPSLRVISLSVLSAAAGVPATREGDDTDRAGLRGVPRVGVPFSDGAS